MDILLKKIIPLSRTAFLQGTKLQTRTTYYHRSMATENPKIESLDYKALKERIARNSIHLIDVREPNEVNETGVIPGSIHIPLGEVECALQLPTDQFQQKYNVAKPEKTSYVIFYCRSGRRSLMASEIATKLGYSRLGNYEGGMLDWMNQTKDQ